MWQKIKNYYHLAQAFLAAAFYSFPAKEIKVVGVSGTDGKTTTVHMIYEILAGNGIKASYISSLHAAIGSKIFKTGFHVTTPSAWQIQKLLRQAVNARNNYFIIEATSHGLDQNRLSFINFEIGLITNITHEHLDYHKNLENYTQAKLKLLKASKFRIINFDDNSTPSVKKNINGNITTFGLTDESDINPESFPLKLSVFGKFNLYNALAACAAAEKTGLTKFKIVRAINKFKSVEGRMQEVSLGQNFKVYIDFAHTPNALKEALESLKKEQKSESKIITVFGSAGKRDKTKRPLMGSAADVNADIIILTAEDPRDESIDAICADIKSGIKNKKTGKTLFIINDREKAIEFALNSAQDDDIVAIFGKGHERSMSFGRAETPWNELEAVKKALKRRLSAKKHQ